MKGSDNDMIKTQTVKLHPNKTMQKHLDDLCDYRRYCWNLGLELWNDMYDESLIMDDKSLHPNGRKIRNQLVHDKQDWQYTLSSRCLQLAVKDLDHAWQSFFKYYKDGWGEPHYKSKKDPHQSFKTDRAKLINSCLRLDKAHGIKDWYDIPISGLKLKDAGLKLVSIYRENNRYYAALTFDVEIKIKCKTQRKTAVDLNVGHFNYTNGVISVLPKKLQKLYQRINYYQSLLARKRQANGKLAYLSNNYTKTRAKLKRDYRKVAQIQNDIIHKFTTKLVNDYDTIVIEDLDVKQMQMTHVASKGLQRSQFGKFRQYLTYKCEWYDKKLILADPYYPSTQRCSNCGYVKHGDEKITLQGNQKHHTKHNEYICYHCGMVMDRDQNAVQNLLALA